MKKNMKKVLILFIIIFLTGCSGNYNLTINDDMSVDEELYLTIDGSDMYEKTIKIFEDNDVNTENYTVLIVDDEVQITYTESFESIEEYILNSKVYHQLIENIEYNKTGNYVDLYVNENLKIKTQYTSLNGSNLNDFDMIQINIINPFDVNYSNAEIVNNNIYTWTLTEENTMVKIQMQFKPELDVFPYREVIVGIVLLICFMAIVIGIYMRYKGRQKV